MSDQDQDQFRELHEDDQVQEQEQPQDNAAAQNEEVPQSEDKRESEDQTNEEQWREMDGPKEPAEAESGANLPAPDEGKAPDDKEYPEEEAPPADNEQIQEAASLPQQMDNTVEPQQQGTEDPQPENVQPEYPQEDDLQPAEAQPEKAQPEEAQPEEAQPEEAQPEEALPEEAQPEYPQEDDLQLAEAQPEKAQPEEAQPEEAQAEEAQPEYPQEDDLQPAEAQPEKAQPEEAQPEYPQEREQQHQKEKPACEKTALIRTASLESDIGDASPHHQKVHHAFKPRNTPRTQPIRWEPIEFDPREDNSDEFEMGTAKRPIYLEEGQTPPEGQPVFKNGEPDYHGEYLSCFDEPNLLYRIINHDEKTWAFYNDSRCYEMHLQFIFGKESKIEPLENTTIYTKSSGEHVARVIVYPGETEMFVKGSINGFTSRLRAIPLSEDYYICRQSLSESIIKEEVERVRRIAGGETDAEKVLKLCVEHNIPFVDLEFPPCQASLDTGAKRPFKKLAWYRPSRYLPDEMVNQIRLFRGRIHPAGVDPGELGDSWVMCCIVAVSEHPQKLTNMFCHPTDPEMGKKERAVGGYRVSFNKNGLWRSVIVDDYLPTSGGVPKYAKSSRDLAELWPSILEKAFAKLHGSYANICSGDPLHALQDMTGYPSWRFDEAFAEDSRTQKDDLFQLMIKYANAGYQMILSTPGKESNDRSSSNDCELTNRYKKAGLMTGHAYTILDVKHFPENAFRLIKIRNAWGRGAEWNGDWCDNDEKWEKFPEIAKTCNFQKAEDGTFWMTWEACLYYFNGGGVSFVNLSLNDYRVLSQFTNATPSTILEVIVEEPTWICFTISQVDKRCRTDVSEYQPVMLSVTQPVEGEMYKVIRNSSADARHPLSDKWSFYQARDISLIYKFLPENSPYLIVPRIMAIEGQIDTMPYVLGISCNKVIGQEGVTVNFKSINDGNKVLQNFPKFVPETAGVEAEYQVKLVGKSFSETRKGSTMY